MSIAHALTPILLHLSKLNEAPSPQETEFKSTMPFMNEMSVWRPQLLAGVSNWLVEGAMLPPKTDLFLVDIQVISWNRQPSWFIVIASPGIQCPPHLCRWPRWLHSQHCPLWSEPWAQNYCSIWEISPSEFPFPLFLKPIQGSGFKWPWLLILAVHLSSCVS